MEKLKIGITCYPTVGGSGVIATELGKLLAERGHDIHFISSSLPFRLDRMYHNVFYHQVEVNQYSVFQYPPYDIALSSKIADVARRENLDILHVHYAIPHAVCAILAKQMSGCDFKIVTTLHGTDITVLGDDPSLTGAIKFGIEQSDIVTAVSKSLVNQTNEIINPKPKRPITSVYNFVDERIYKRSDESRLKKEFCIKETEKVIIHVSNFRPVKRVSDVVKVFRKILDQLPAKLLLVGDGPEMTIICQLVERLQLTDHVLFLGNQENLTDLYSISDLMLLISKKESFGLVLLEAMACGVPCIGTNVGGIPEVITDGKTGFVCKVGNVEEIANKALSILLDDELHHKFAENALKEVSDQFSAKEIVTRYEEIYVKLLNDR